MTKAKIEVGSKWAAKDGRVFIVTEKLPFGRIVLQQEGRMSYHGETTQKSLLANMEAA